MRYNLILNILGMISKYMGYMFIIPIVASILLNEPKEAIPFVVSGLIAVIIGCIFSIPSVEQKQIDNIKKTESLAIVFFSWVLFSIIASIPYHFYGFDFTNACFEAVSGITTTGSTVMTDFSLYPRTLFFFRSLTQWVGGMGIVVLFIAVLPKIAVAGREMFYAEAPVPTEDKATPRIRYTATWLWGIYLTFTIMETLVLKLLGLDFYHATIVSFSTISTGGFSALPASIAGYENPLVSICVALFMFVAAINYILIYRLIKSRKVKSLFKSEEFKVYAIVVLTLTIFLAISLIINANYELKQSLLSSFFAIVTTLTSTGFALDNYIYWDGTSKAILYLAFFSGGCATSTSGGIKIIRWIFIFKYLKRELNKIIHPKAVYPIKLESHALSQDVSSQMMAFVVYYLSFFALGAFLIVLVEHNTIVALSASATAIGNIGPGYSIIGPMDTFNVLHSFTKWVLIMLMLIGRLEIIPFLALLNKDLWKN